VLRLQMLYPCFGEAAAVQSIKFIVRASDLFSIERTLSPRSWNGSPCRAFQSVVPSKSITLATSIVLAIPALLVGIALSRRKGADQIDLLFSEPLMSFLGPTAADPENVHPCK
jgi:hypothetical protein